MPRKVDWDESLPMDMHTKWTRYYAQLPLLNDIILKWKTITTETDKIELHGFCDASERAYGACICARSIVENDRTHVELLAAKSKVTLLETQFIPRLELCRALLASLYDTVRKAMHVPIEQATFWTDSPIVLHWLNTYSHTH